MWFRRAKPATFWDGQSGPAPERAVAAPKQKLSWFEKRDRRRRRRKTFEEVLGWILVPAFIYLLYLGYKAVGGIPKEVVDFGRELIELGTNSLR